MRGGGNGITFVKEPSVIEQKAYRDTWGKGLDSYLKWFYETVVLLRELLADNGSLYVHLDQNVGTYAKCVLDEVFGSASFGAEIVWKRADSHNDAHGYGVIHDVLYYYTKNDNAVFNPQFVPLSEKTVDSWYRHVEADTGRHYNLGNLVSPHPRPNLTYEFKGIKPPTNGWRVSRQRMEEYDRKNLLIVVGKSEKTYKVKQYLDESKGKQVTDWWDDISQIRGYSAGADERLGYPTQKPEALLERVIKTSSNEGDLVLDCFCGSGTTAAVAEKLNRRWITCDLGRFAIHTARKRLLAIDKVKPFMVQNLGKYERQQWQTAEFGERAEIVQHNYRKFILSLYRAQPLTGYVWLHGVRAGRFVHVGDVAAPISTSDVAHIAAEFRRAVGTGENAPTQSSVDILGWDFAFELNEVAKQQAALAGIEVRFVRIPREVLEKKAVEQGDIKFFELAALSVRHEVNARAVSLELTDFVIPLDDVPDDVQRAITHWEQWIDYWAVDWDNQGDTFHNQWQSYRTRKDRNLQKRIVTPPGTYAQAGIYKVVIKVIDILGNDTTKTLSVTIT